MFTPPPIAYEYVVYVQCKVNNLRIVHTLQYWI